MSRLTEKLPVIKQIKQIDYNYKSNIFGGIVEEDKKENAVWLFHNIVEKLAEYENLGSVEEIVQKIHEFEVYKRAFDIAVEDNCNICESDRESLKWLFLDQARKELEDESKTN